jgi:hypothetical protein
MKRYKIEYVNSFEDYGDAEGRGVFSEDCSGWADTIEQARDLAATLSEQFQRAEVFDASLLRGAVALEVWEGVRRQS